MACVVGFQGFTSSNIYHVKWVPQKTMLLWLFFKKQSQKKNRTRNSRTRPITFSLLTTMDLRWDPSPKAMMLTQREQGHGKDDESYHWPRQLGSFNFVREESNLLWDFDYHPSLFTFCQDWPDSATYKTSFDVSPKRKDWSYWLRIRAPNQTKDVPRVPLLWLSPFPIALSCLFAIYTSSFNPIRGTRSSSTRARIDLNGYKG